MKIIVSGPQRSGTRIAAKIYAQKHNIPFLDEAVIENDSWKLFLSLQGDYCLQAPGLSHRVHQVPPDVEVVFMLRDPKDIIESNRRRMNRFNRISAKGIQTYTQDVFTEKKKLYDKHFPETSYLPMPEQVYEVWYNIQRPLISNYFEQDYEDLRNHPLWVPKQERLKFTSGTQTK